MPAPSRLERPLYEGTGVVPDETELTPLDLSSFDVLHCHGDDHLRLGAVRSPWDPDHYAGASSAGSAAAAGRRGAGWNVSPV